MFASMSFVCESELVGLAVLVDFRIREVLAFGGTLVVLASAMLLAVVSGMASDLMSTSLSVLVLFFFWWWGCRVHLVRIRRECLPVFREGKT